MFSISVASSKHATVTCIVSESRQFLCHVMVTALCQFPLWFDGSHPAHFLSRILRTSCHSLSLFEWANNAPSHGTIHQWLLQIRFKCSVYAILVVFYVILLALKLAFSHFSCTQSEKEKRDVVIEEQQNIASVYAACHGVVATVVVVQVQCYYK